jgi:hypothetical protein
MTRTRTRLRHVIWLTAVLALVARTAAAQTPRDGRVVVTVADQTGGVLPGATVTLVREDPPGGAGTPTTVPASAEGVATFAAVSPGRYTITAEFGGFETRTLTNVRVRAGDNRQSVSLAIQRLETDVVVGQDKDAAASDRRGVTFGSALTREQIDALSDDPEILRRQLNEIAGGAAAVIRVDSFEGGELPPKSMIKSIHVTRDGFAAENHNAGAFFIDIVTQPGVGPLRGQTFYRLRDGSLTGRSPFVPTKGPERLQQAGLAIGGTLIPQKSGFNMQIARTASFDTPILNAALPGGTRSELLSLRTPRENIQVFSTFDYAITRDQTLRVGYQQNTGSTGNLGIGEYNLPERAYSTTDGTWTLRVQEAGPLGRRFFINTRLFLNRLTTSNLSAVEVPTIRVNDAFTSGGAQNAGNRRTLAFNVASDLDYVRGIHSVRTGIALDNGWTDSSLTQNYLGTYTFESLAAYAAGQPRSYTRRIGDPAIDVFHTTAAVYVQDDIRVRRNLTLSPGLRYEAQTHVKDYNNLGPRFGVTWSPFRSGVTTIRSSAGIFYDWLTQNSLEQVLRVDGLHQREVNLFNPAYPDPGVFGVLPPANRYLYGPDLEGPRSTRFSVGLDQSLRPEPVGASPTRIKVRMNLLYAYTRGSSLWRGLNLNAPADGLRPDPTLANVVEVVSDARSEQHSLTVGWNIGIPPQPLTAQAPRRWQWSRIAVYGANTFTWAKNDTDGELEVPATGDLVHEWGRSMLDIPYRLNVNVTSLQLRNLSATVSLNGNSELPYTLRTGVEDNRDLIFNVRPAGVARNTLRGDSQWTLSSSLQYSLPVRRRAAAGPGGVMVTNLNGRIAVNEVGGDTARYRINFIVQMQNITNRYNYVGYSGVMTSPLFNRPTATAGPRRIDAGVMFTF